MAGTACVSCENVDPTDLTEANLPVKSIVCGHVRFVPTGKDPVNAGVGLDVNIFYGQKDDKGNVEYALKTVKTLQYGYFETTIGCPVGQNLEIKVECTAMSQSEASVTGKTDKHTGSTYFHAEVAKSVTCGTAAYFPLDMKPAAYISTPGLVQP